MFIRHNNQFFCYCLSIGAEAWRVRHQTEVLPTPPVEESERVNLLRLLRLVEARTRYWQIMADRNQLGWETRNLEILVGD